MITFPGGLTVLMSVWNRDDPILFSRAVESVYANTVKPDAMILVIDGPVNTELESTAFTLRKKHGFTILYLTENVGLALALNSALEYVQTEWIARADADDYNLPRRFEIQAKAIACKNEIDIIGGSILEVDIHSRPLNIRRTKEDHFEIIKFTRYRNPFNHMSVIFRTKMIKSCGGYPNIYLKEDYGLWCLMLGNGAIGFNVPDILVEATAGIDIYKRRGGVRYALSEIPLQKLLINCGFKSPPQAVYDGLLRSFVYIIPHNIRAFIYKKYLRN